MKIKHIHLPHLVSAIAGLGLLLGVSARAADPVITNPVDTTIGIVTGGDVGEGLDLDGEFVYALSIGAATDFTSKVRSATFLGLIDAEVPGATLVAGNRIENWYIINYGDSENDDALEAATSSIRWSDAASASVPEVVLTLEKLEIGVQYKVQMLFGEQCCNRGFDVFFDDQLVVKDFNPGVVHGGIAQGSQEALITHLFTPKKSTAVLRFDGREASSDYSDHNAILNAVTVEKAGIPVDTDKDGMPDTYETQFGFNPNDASDAAKDFDSDGVSNLDEFKAGTDPTDVTKPTILSSATAGTYKEISLTFSEDLDVASATTIANYSISPALAVTGATYKKKVVTLTTAAQTPGATKYTVTVTGVRDLSKNAVAADTKAVVYSFLAVRSEVLKFSYWVATGAEEAGTLNGTAVTTLLEHPRYPASPNLVLAVNSFDSRDAFPDDSHEQFGATIEGYLTPTETADYDFFLRSDDASQLLISTDDKPANLTVIAEETGCCKAFLEPGAPTTTATPIRLTAGKKYFIQVIYKEGGGGDYAQVAWRKVGDTTLASSLTPIPGKFLSAAVDLPTAPGGAFVSQIPAPRAKGVSPATKIIIVHRDGKTPWTAENTSLKFDGVAVSSTFKKDGQVATIEFVPPALLASLSTHTVTLGYRDPGGDPATLEYAFTTFAYKGTSKDTVGGYAGLIAGSAVFTEDAGGHTAKAGDYGINLTLKGGPVVTYDSAFLAAANAATAKDELSVVFWQKKLDTADSSAFTMNSPSSGNNRGFHAHVPWSNQNIYFDTVGCCDGATQRINADINTFPDYTTGDPRDNLWWTTKWHLFAFTKKGSSKNIYVDGKPFLSGESTLPLPADINAFYMGSGANGSELSHAIIDDFSIYSKELTEADVLALSKGTLPSALPAAKGLIGYWNFNDKSVAPPTPPALSAAAGAKGKVVVTFEGTLQKASALGGAFTDVVGASPLTLDAADAAGFFRAIKK